MKDMYSVLSSPHVTEKATFQRENANQIAFKVNMDANKVEIRQAVEKFFGVKVFSVKTVVMKGKPKRMGRYLGKRPDYKKAIVRLYPGQDIDFFEGV